MNAAPRCGLARRLAAEALGTGLLVAAVVGSGVMAARLADGNAALALLANTLAYGVGLYITSAYWFTAWTSFANPAVTLARALTATYAGIRPADAAAFVAAQLLGSVAAAGCFGWLIRMPAQAAAAGQTPAVRAGP